MRKYLSAIKMGLVQNLTEKEIIFLWTLNSAIALISVLSIWMASDSQEIAGYTKPELMSYYFVLFILTPFTSWHVFWDMRGDIMNGAISNYLLKPYRYIIALFCQEFGFKLVQIVIQTVVGGLIYLFIGNLMTIRFNFLTVLKLIPVMLIAIGIEFSISFAMGCVTFVWEESRFIADFKWMITSFFGGRYLPLSFFPAALLGILQYNPFRFVISLPVEVIFNQLSNNEYLVSIIVGSAWVLFFVVLAQFAWKKGLRKYSAFGC